MISLFGGILSNIMSGSELDRTDLRILEALQHDGRITNADLAEKVSLSASACAACSGWNRRV